MAMKLLSADAFRDAAKDGGSVDGTVFRFATTEPVTVDGVERTKRFVFSDATVDHAGDSIDPKGWDLAIFKRNPVALFSHMSWEPPIGRASNVHVENNQLVGDIEFATADIYDFADTIFRLVDGGFMNAVSVGFKPKEWAFTADKDRPYGIDFKKQTLLEISVCPVPCNPSALGEARSLGIDTAPLREWAEKVLDSGDTVFLPRTELETLRKQASDKELPRYYIRTDATLSVEVAERVRAAVKRWQDDPAEVLMLPTGIDIRSVSTHEVTGDGPPSPQFAGDTEAAIDDLVARGLVTAEGRAAVVELVKAGRRISAATKAKLAEAMGHHDETAKCIKSIMDDGGDDDGDPDGDADDVDSDPSRQDPQPPGTVVTESDENLSPAERRLKEARALKAALTPND